MASLREAQAAFARALKGDAAAAAALVHDDGLAAARRIAVYANNSHAAFANALALTFPAVRRLGGDDWFAGAVRAYRTERPSRSGDLHHAAAGFPAFLGARLGETPHAFMADVAALEWACADVLVAPDAPHADLAALAETLANAHARLRFRLHPAVRVVASRWPVLDAWRANRDDAPADATVDLDAGPQRVLVLRRGDDVELHPLDAAAHACLAALAAGESLAAAADRAFDVEPGFDLGAALCRWASLGVLVGADAAADDRAPACADGGASHDA